MKHAHEKNENGYFTADVRSAQYYYPFGMMMPGRNYNAGDYRFTFNGQEKVDEVSGIGNHNTAMFWEYDTRLGRRWNVDPKVNPSISSYATFVNNPIFYSDVLGDTSANFDTQGKFVDLSDKDIPGVRGVIGTTSQVKDAKGNSVDQFTPVRKFNFNDPGFDKNQVLGLKKGDQALIFMSDENINALEDNSSIFSDEAQGPIDKILFAKNESNGGKMDYSALYFQPSQGLNSGVQSDGKGGFVLFQNNSTAYNLMDAGNFMWGHSMYDLKFNYRTAQFGSQWFAGFKDSPADQKAIHEGFFYNTLTQKRTMNDVFKQLPSSTIKPNYKN